MIINLAVSLQNKTIFDPKSILQVPKCLKLSQRLIFSLKPSEVQPNLKVNPFWDDFLAFWHLFEVIFIE